MNKSKETKSFLVAIITIFILMLFTYILSLTMDGCNISFVKWLLSPILVLGSDSSSTIIAVIVFLLVIGGVCNLLESCGFIEYMLNKICTKYYKKKYVLMYLLVFFFMAMGSLIGSFEEVVPLVPIVVALSVKLGFDAFIGVGMSLLAVGCGFAAGVLNPFTIGVAQQLAGLPMFSGALFRLFGFVLIYLLLIAFLTYNAKKIEKKNAVTYKFTYTKEESKEKALKLFAVIMGAGFITVISSSFITVLQDYTMIIIALMFLVAGITASLVSGLRGKKFAKSFVDGILEIAPSILLILMASSIKYTMDESGIMNVMLNWAVNKASGMNKVELILFIYAICLVMEVFIPSGSAKAFLLIPLIVPLASTFGLSSQLCVLAYAFGDGFSNVLYPTNPALLISLGLINMDYKKWFNWSIRFQLLNLVLTSLILLLGLVINYV